MPEKIRCDPVKRKIVAPSKEWLSVEDCAEWIGVSVSTMNRIIRDGNFLDPGIEAGKAEEESAESRSGRAAARRWHWADFWAWCQLTNKGYRVAKRGP